MTLETAPDGEQVVRLAAKGDGVTAGGVHGPGALPGDFIDQTGAITRRGPHHQNPPCKHFGTCGGCQLQHADDAALRNFVRDRVVNAALGQGLEIGEELKTHLSPKAARRRATLHAVRTGKGAIVGFKQSGSHTILDCRECPVLVPQLEQLISPLRTLIAQYGPAKGAQDIQMTLTDQGADLGLSNFPLDQLSAIEALSDFAREYALARITVDHGFGPETQWEPVPVTVTLGGVAVPLPPGAFLQATSDAQDVMVADALSFAGDAARVADLFAGLGTFAFALSKGRKTLAAEADQAAHRACKAASTNAAGAVFPIHRDLFRNPVQPDELSRFDCVLLDPPRAGAKAQVDAIAESSCDKVVYVSCNPSSWARDAARLAAGGFKLAKLRPIGQFRWSTHVELISLFQR